MEKQPVVCRSTPGFIVNRVARPFYAETLRALEEQIATPATLDAVLRDAGGFAMGPLQLTDLIGHDVNYAVTESVFHAFGSDPRFQPSLVQKELVEAGHLGRKSDRGFTATRATFSLLSLSLHRLKLAQCRNELARMGAGRRCLNLLRCCNKMGSRLKNAKRVPNRLLFAPR